MALLSSTSGAPFMETYTLNKQGGATQSDSRRFYESPTVEDYVRAHFENNPIMAEIARCESSFRHFDKNGNIMRGEVNSLDVGVMQINEYYHTETSDNLGFNIYTLEGNLNYAKYLFEKEGTRPWNASSKCWRTGNHIAKG